MKPALRLTILPSILLLSLLLMTACSPVRLPEATPQPAQSATAGESAANTAGAPAEVLAAIANDLGVQPAELTVVSAEAVEWNDACLGVVNMDEMCAQVITPGYSVVVEVSGKRYTYHTDRSGASIRQAPNEQDQSDKAGELLNLGRLSYAGPEEVGSGNTARCAQMELLGSVARLTACDGAETTLPLPENLANSWQAMSERLGSFTYETPVEQITVAGQGEGAAPEWQRAALVWARMTHVELAGGQTSATARTALSWNLGLLPDTPGVCAHLTVLDYGYAYAEQRACEGGDLVSSAEGWLEQGEMEQFDRWLYEYAPLYADDNYVNGVGEANMTEDEAAAVTAWAQAVWERLGALPLVPADASAASPCTAGADEEIYSSTDYGFCLAVPAGYAVVETAPGSFSLVRDGDLMNHTDPRISLEVSDAGDYTLAQVADQMVQNYVPAGEPNEPQSVTVGGVEGVLLDNLPGQDLNRRLAVVNNGRVYSLMLMPLSPDAETFYQGVLNSLQFLGD